MAHSTPLPFLRIVLNYLPLVQVGFESENLSTGVLRRVTCATQTCLPVTLTCSSVFNYTIALKAK